MEFLEVPLFDDDFFKLLVRLSVDLVFVALVVAIYFYFNQKNRAYTFTFIMMNVMVFFICFTLKKFQLELGMALGLFAIFAIIRYRTDSINVKEMTYLFVVIGFAVINSLSNKNTSYSELFFTNAFVVAMIVVLEKVLTTNGNVDLKKKPKSKTNKLATQCVVYDNLELLKPNRRDELFADLSERTGQAVIDVKISKLDLKTNSASITVYFATNQLDTESN